MKKIIIILLTAAVLAFAAAFYLYRNNSFNDMDAELYDSQAELFTDIKPTGDTLSDDYLAESRKINPQIVAWITIPDSEIDFPVVQCEDNEYYLSHDFENSESYMGTPFLDCRNSADFSDYNSIIYGHNISNNFMFAPLTNFKDNDYFDSHSFGYLTLTDTKCKINFIACAVIENDDFAYNTVFLSQKEKEVFLKTMKEKSVQLRDFNVEDVMEARLCTFSTCSYEFSNARTVLIGYIEPIDE